ncbi:hypothetical protein M3Y98_00898500 [Aphelenchoides besseyi]|nr:hypothetical protein M3Y98_00898500 [Aphelenchoides besseyi]KAI6193650.1 hypothetical protein M3Y96_01041200 [Aphelenchoides besseyi]
MSANKVTMVLHNGEKLMISELVLQAAGRFNDSSEKENLGSIQIPEQWAKDNVRFLMTFFDFMEKNFKEELRANDCEQNDFWFNFVWEHRDKFEKLGRKFNKHKLPSCASFAEWLMCPSFLHYTTHLMSIHCVDMNLSELRKYLDQTDDFSAEKRELMSQCFEFKNL